MVDPKWVGKVLPTVKYEVGLEKIKEYALAVNDHNPLYLDEEAAKAGPYGQIVAPPMFAVVYSKEFIHHALFDKDLSMDFSMLVHGEQEFVFHRLVRPGDVVITSGKVKEIVNKENLDLVTFESESRVNGELVTTGIYTMAIRR